MGKGFIYSSTKNRYTSPQPERRYKQNTYLCSVKGPRTKLNLARQETNMRGSPIGVSAEGICVLIDDVYESVRSTLTIAKICSLRPICLCKISLIVDLLVVTSVTASHNECSGVILLQFNNTKWMLSKPFKNYFTST